MGPNHVLDKGYLVDASATVANLVQFRAVILNSSNTVVTGAGASADVLGVTQYTAGDAAKIATGKVTVGVRLLGITRWEAGAAVARRARVTSDSSGRCVGVTRAIAGAQPAIVAGIAQTPASAAGDYIDVLL